MADADRSLAIFDGRIPLPQSGWHESSSFKLVLTNVTVVVVFVVAVDGDVTTTGDDAAGIAIDSCAVAAQRISRPGLFSGSRDLSALKLSTSFLDL